MRKDGKNCKSDIQLIKMPGKTLRSHNTTMTQET